MRFERHCGSPGERPTPPSTSLWVCSGSPECGKRWHQVPSIFPGPVCSARGPSHLDDDEAREATDLVLGAAPRLTTGQVAARISRVTLGLHPDDAARRYETVVEQRQLVLHQGADGTAELAASCLPPTKQ